MNVQEHGGDTPLHTAVDHSRYDVMRLLLAADPPPLLNLQGQELLTPLTFACAKGDVQMVHLLLAHRPAPDINIRNKWGASALDVAVSGGFIDVVRALLEHEPPPTCVDARARLITATIMRKSGYTDIADEIENLKIARDEL